MKKFLLVAVALICTIVIPAKAQQAVCKGQSPKFTAKGDFNNELTNSTTTYNYKSSQLPLYTTQDSVEGAGGVDTFRFQLIGEVNSLTFQWNLTKVGGRVDSFTVTYWASIDGVNYFTLSSTTAANTTGTAAYSYLVNSGSGNVYAYYMLTASCTNAATGSAGVWQGYALVR